MPRSPLPAPMTFVFPLPPNRANARGHWRKAYREQAKFYAECDMRVLAKLMPKPPAAPWMRASITAELTMRNPMDDDNALARCKWVCDFLVTRGYILDDRKGRLDWDAIPTQKISRKEPTCIIVTLTAREGRA